MKYADKKALTLNTHSHEFLNDTHVSYGPSILTVIFGMLVMVMYFQVVFGVGQGFTFTGLLNALSNAPSIDISWMAKLTSFEVDIPVIGTIVKILTGVLSVAIYMSVGVAQLIVYVGFILGLLVGLV